MEAVWPGYCADPFVIYDGARYVMYGTTPGVLHDGLAFQMLLSDDLRTWLPAGGALVPTGDATALTEHWAPEVVAAEGAFWMYYSAGEGEVGHHIRVAKASTATGPFIDCGVDLTPELPFAIDPSPFRDVDGCWWLFLATDEVTGERPGTVVAAARMTSMTSIEAPTIVLRATADWQRYESDRKMYGATYDWHTVEGPCLVRRGDSYWLLYAGGNWQTAGYGVGFATATRAAGPYDILDNGPTLLGSDTDRGLVGPGHCSVVTSTDGTDYLVFHGWDESATIRRPYVQALDFRDGTPRLSTADERSGASASID